MYGETPKFWSREKTRYKFYQKVKKPVREKVDRWIREHHYVIHSPNHKDTVLTSSILIQMVRIQIKIQESVCVRGFTGMILMMAVAVMTTKILMMMMTMTTTTTTTQRQTLGSSQKITC